MAKRGRPAKKKTTKPWEGADNPWTKDVFKLPKQHKGFHPCFVGKKDVDDYLSKGYVYANPEDYGIIKSDESDKGISPNRVYRKETVLLELPNHLKKMLDDYQRDYIDQQTQGALRSDSDRVSKDSGGGITTKLETTVS